MRLMHIGRTQSFGLRGALLATLSLGVLFATGAHADALSDLRTTLAALDGDSPIQATLDVKSTVVNKKENGGKPESAEARLDIQAGDGLSLHVQQTTLQQAATELAAAATNTDHPTPMVGLLNRHLEPITIAHLVSEGPNLLRLLGPATTATVKSTTLWGKPVHELEVSLPKPKSSNFKLKDFSDTLSVWMDTKGVPIAAAEQTHGKGCLLFLCMDVTESSSYALEVVAGRLVATTLTTDQKQNGLGQDSDTHITYTLQVQQAANTAAPAAISKPD